LQGHAANTFLPFKTREAPHFLRDASLSAQSVIDLSGALSTMVPAVLITVIGRSSLGITRIEDVDREGSKKHGRRIHFV